MKTPLLLLSLIILSFFTSYSQDRVYWSDQQDPDKIVSVNASDLGSLLTPVYPSVPNGVAYFHANPTYPLFYIASTEIYRNDLAGHSNLLLTTSNQFNRGLAIDYVGKKIYWTNSQLGTIGRANLDGTEKNESFLTGLSEPWAIEIDPVNQKLYWTEDVAGGAIKRANLSDGSNIESVVTGVQSLGLAVDPVRNKLFFTTFPDSKVHSANLDGTNQVVIPGLAAIADIEVNGATGSIYTIDYQSNPLTKSNPDGTGKTSISARGSYITYADITTPVITAITRQTPAATTLGQNATATFRVTFSEPVLNFDVTDLKLDSPIEGTVTVTSVSPHVMYDVTVQNITGAGTLGLGLSATQNIVDFRGNVFAGTITTKQSYTIIAAPTPVITGFDPSTAPINGVVTINGTGFSATTGDNTVTFNGVIAQVTASTTTTLTTAVPAGATDGPIAVSVNGLTATSQTNFVVCIPPAKPVITHEAGMLTSSSSTNNQWLRNGVVIPGATSQSYPAIEGGAYSVRVTANGCSAESDPTTVVGVDESLASSPSIYPNPVSNVVRVEVPSHQAATKVDIYTMTGQLKQSIVLTSPSEDLDVSNYGEGMYVIVVTTPQRVITKKFQKITRINGLTGLQD